MRIFLAVACVALVACGSSPTSPPQQGGLVLTASIARSIVPAGQTATLTFALQNAGPGTVTLHFSDGCQLMPYIVNSTGQVVYPEGGGWGCTLALTQLTLPPGGAEARTVQVGSAAQGAYPYASLAPGQYSAYAKVPSGEYKLQSDPVQFTVQ